MVDIVIPTYQGREDKLQKLLATIPKGYNVIIVDGDMSLAEKRNTGASKGKNKFILFIDDDNEIAQGSIEEAIKLFKENIGVVGFIATYDDKRDIVCDSGSFRNLLTGFTKDKYVNKNINKIKGSYYVDEIANAFMVKRVVFESFEGFNAKSFPIDLDEADLCMRLKKAGFDILVSPKVRVYHKSITYSRIPDFRRTKNAYYMGRNRILFQKLYGSLLFVPVFVALYSLILLGRGKVKHLYYFIKGVIDGVKGRTGYNIN